MNFRLTTLLGFESFLPTQVEVDVLSNPNVVDLSLTVYPSWFYGCSLTWSSLPSWVGKSVSFNVYRSEVEGGKGLKKLNSVPLLQAQFIDEATRESSNNSDEYYVIEACVRETPSVTSTWVTRPKSVADDLPRWHALRFKEINRRHWVLLRKLAGTEALILRKRAYGPRCSNCWDDVSRRVIKDDCEVCYGVGIEGGYYESIPTYIQFDSSNNNTIYSYFGKFEPNEIGAWTISYPRLESHDLLIRKKDLSVFRIEGLSPTEMLNKPCRQIMKLVQLPKTHTAIKLLKREGLIPGLS